MLKEEPRLLLLGAAGLRMVLLAKAEQAASVADKAAKEADQCLRATQTELEEARIIVSGLEVGLRWVNRAISDGKHMPEWSTVVHRLSTLRARGAGSGDPVRRAAADALDRTLCSPRWDD